ncbi:MAG: DUF1295 domain-containing protein [Ruminococcus sp.]|nr:DUF1295 domain-containing protein [Candidatus Apopatosoma intestinale]
MIGLWGFFGILCAVCAVLCAVGFYKFVYFLSIGYGFAVAGGGLFVLIAALTHLTEGTFSWILVVQAVLFFAYGFRLSGFLLIREIKNASYRKTLKEATGDEKKMPVFVKATIWICVAVLYTAQLSPMVFRYVNGRKEDLILPLIGIAISVCGLVLETLADAQKTAQKKENPNMVATKGLYKMVRCPNYFGEIVFWTGVFVAGISVYQTAWQWIVAILALICITYIMFNGAQRLEKRQNGRYGDMPEYQAYTAKTPIILPLLPIYHLVKKEK